jgi:hypothetical protein
MGLRVTLNPNKPTHCLEQAEHTQHAYVAHKRVQHTLVLTNCDHLAPEAKQDCRTMHHQYSSSGKSSHCHTPHTRLQHTYTRKAQCNTHYAGRGCVPCTQTPSAALSHAPSGTPVRTAVQPTWHHLTHMAKPTECISQGKTLLSYNTVLTLWHMPLLRHDGTVITPVACDAHDSHASHMGP